MQAQLSETDVRALYESADSNGKSILEKNYGKNFFSLDWNELFSNFCKKNKLTITHDAAEGRKPGYAYIPFASPADAQEEHDNASRMLRKIIELNNKEKKFVVNYKDKKQERWFPVGEVTEAGFAFSTSDYEYWDSSASTVVGSPFVSPTSDEAKRIFMEFMPIYKKYYIV